MLLLGTAIHRILCSMYIHLLMVFVAATSLRVGDRAPDFTATDTEGRAVVLSKLLANGPVVLTFYPKAFTSGCTKQMKQYGELQNSFSSVRAQIVAVSADDLETQRKFRADTNALFPYIADPEGRIIELYGIKTPVVTFAKRTTFVIGADGLIKAIRAGDDVIDVPATLEDVRRTCRTRAP